MDSSENKIRKQEYLEADCCQYRQVLDFYRIIFGGEGESSLFGGLKY
jgi:hypothetical protein